MRGPENSEPGAGMWVRSCSGGRVSGVLECPGKGARCLCARVHASVTVSESSSRLSRSSSLPLVAKECLALDRCPGQESRQTGKAAGSRSGN